MLGSEYSCELVKDVPKSGRHILMGLEGPAPDEGLARSPDPTTIARATSG